MPSALVVSDSDWVVDDVRATLTVGNWDIDHISDPRVAADHVLDTRPDVVIVDLQVGSMGGMAIIRSIRAVSTERPPRMVMLLDRSADAFIAKRALADASVLKPFLASELRHAVSGTAIREPARAASEEE